MLLLGRFFLETNTIPSGKPKVTWSKQNIVEVLFEATLMKRGIRSSLPQVTSGCAYLSLLLIWLRLERSFFHSILISNL